MTLREYLDWKKLKATEFAQISGLSPQYISMIMNYRQRASMAATISIHQATDGTVTFEDLAFVEVEA